MEKISASDSPDIYIQGANCHLILDGFVGQASRLNDNRAAFIANAPSDIRALLDMVEELEKVDKLLKELGVPEHTTITASIETLVDSYDAKLEQRDKEIDDLTQANTEVSGVLDRMCDMGTEKEKLEQQLRERDKEIEWLKENHETFAKEVEAFCERIEPKLDDMEAVHTFMLRSAQRNSEEDVT